MGSSDKTPGAWRTERVRVMVVDDELAIARAYARTLSAADCEVETASDGESARRLLERGPFDVIVSDVLMPGMDGIEVLCAARERDLDVSVILLTGAPTEDAAAKAVESGALLYLVKPLDPRAFVQVVMNGARMTRMARLKRAAVADTGAIDKQVGDRAGLEVAFERALGGMWLAFQPIVRLPARAVSGYEALLRSEEPMLAHPMALLDAAGRLGRLPALGRAVRDAAARAARELPEGTDLFVNVHPSDLADEELFSARSALAGMASRIVLEITERASLSSVHDVEARTAALRGMGYRIALDDFGDGYAGLTSFARLRPDVVKLDLSIVRDVDSDSVKGKLVTGTISMCRDMHVAVVAEGVETAEERAALLDFGCELFQGYLFARPGRPFPAVAW
jgi:EAL domain-containing protein (putative c-di-GMP-specific phosphodiesterase class I)